jgi:hypothetical protein
LGTNFEQISSMFKVTYSNDEPEKSSATNFQIDAGASNWLWWWYRYFKENTDYEAYCVAPLNYEARRDMYVHPTYAVTPQREPLGVLDAWMWAREERDKDGVRHGQKESTRWIEGYERVAEMAAEMPATRLVYVADREAP